MRKVVLTFLILAVVSPCFAKYSGGTGEPNTPYQIANAADLMTLANDANDYNKCFVMTADIDLAPNLPGNQTFTTAVIARDISNTNSIFDGNSFTGVFDGAGHKIINLTINTNNAVNDYLGLFGDINSGEVKNIVLKNVSITGGSVEYGYYSSGYIGGLAGYNGGSISDCCSIANVSSGECLGGLVGYNAGSISNCYSAGAVSNGTGLGGLVGLNAGSISNCHSTDTVSGETILGGFVGYNKGTISNCYSTGAVGGSDHSQDIGGLVGENKAGSISNCYSTGSVSGFSGVGGLVGWNNGGSINGCYARGNVASGKDSRYLGGLVGYNGGSISDCYSTGTVSGLSGSSTLGGFVGSNGGPLNHCYATGNVYGSSSLGGLVGVNDGNIISNCYFYARSGLNNGFGTPLTDAQMKQQVNFVGWDFVWETANGPNDIWAICEGVSYPKLAWQFVAGDSDNDKDVNFIDFAVLGNKWMQADSNLYCGGSDLTGDGLVDMFDIAVFAENWLVNL